MHYIWPVFLDTMQRYLSMIDHGDRERAIEIMGPTPTFTANDFLEAAMMLADELRNPPAVPDAVTEDGKPLYCLESMAARMGIDVDEMPQVFKFFHYEGLVYSIQ